MKLQNIVWYNDMEASMNGNNDLIVEFDGVSLNYHDAQGETAAISNLSFSVSSYP